MAVSSVSGKAERLHATGKVHAVPGAEVFAVEGDHSLYMVVLAPGGAVCTCPARGNCSHLEAARIAQEAHA